MSAEQDLPSLAAVPIPTDEAPLREAATSLGVRIHHCCCDTCWRTSHLCPAVLTDLHADVANAAGDAVVRMVCGLQAFGGAS